MDKFLRKASGYGLGVDGAERQWLRGLYRGLEDSRQYRDSTEDDLCQLTLETLQTILTEFNRNRPDDSDRDTEAPISYSIMSVKTLIRSQSSCCSNLKLTPDDRMRIVKENVAKGHEGLDEVHYLVVGKLTTTPTRVTLSERDKCGDLYFEDGTAAVVCRFLHVDVKWLNQFVIALAWNYIPGETKGADSRKGDGYLEIIDMCLQTGGASPRVEHGSEVVPSPIGLHILQRRNAYNIKLVDIHGEVTALSPVHRIREAMMFFVEITSKDRDISVCLVVKGVEYIHWHQFIQLKEEYVFTYVLPTTLNKESANSFLVFAFTRKSKFYKISSEDCRTMTLEQLEEKFSVKKLQDQGSAVGCDAPDSSGCHGDQEPSTSNHGDSESQLSPCSRQERQEKLSTYQGTITAVTNADAGIYELDNRLRLYICYQPCLSKSRGMRVGAKVKIYNCHFKSYKEVPCLRLCCCTLSSVVIVEFSPLATPYQPFICKSSVFIHLLFLYHLNVPLYQWVVDVEQDMKTKFLPGHLSNSILMGVQFSRHRSSSDRRPVGVFYSLLRLPSPSTQQLLLPQSTRNIYREFIDPIHPCPVTDTQSLSGTKPYEIPTIAYVKDIIQKKSFIAETWQMPEGKTPYNNKALNEAMYWKHQIFESKDFKPVMLLVGYLEVNSRTGCLQLVDQTGGIDCVIADYDNLQDVHSCTDKCLNPTMNMGSCNVPFPCPYAKTWCRGQLLRLDKYQIVSERFAATRFPSIQDAGDQTYIEKSHIRCYVQFAMSDAVSLHRKTGQHRKAQKRRQGDSEASTSGEQRSEETTDVVQLFTVSHKNSLHLSQAARARANAQTLKCNVAVTFIGAAKLVPSDRTVAWKDLTEGGGTDNGSADGPSQAETGNMDLTIRQVVLILQHESTKWYPLLEIGQTYALIKPSSKDLSAFQAQLPSAALQRAVKMTDCQTGFLITADMVIMPAVGASVLRQTDPNAVVKLASQIYVMSASEKETSEKVLTRMKSKLENRIQTVQEVMGSRVSSGSPSQVSIRCRVVSRTFYHPVSKFRSRMVTDAGSELQKVKSFGVSTLNNKAVRLLVSDLSSPDQLFIYLDLDNISYPLALLPEAVVTFRYLNKFSSRKSNIYCQFVANSSVTVEKFPSPTIQLNRGNLQGSTATDSRDTGGLDKLRQRYLCEYTQQQQQRGTGRVHQIVSRIHAHIVTVLNVSLRYSCTGCGSAFQGGFCRNPNNRCSSTSAHFETKASFIIEDGTFEARAHCNSDQVASLLNLSPLQWQRLQDHVYQSGEVVYRCRGNECSTESEHYGRMNPAERVLQKLCTSQLVCRSAILYCKQFQQNDKTGAGGRFGQSNSDYQIRTCEIGRKQFQTKYLPQLNLFCVSLKSMDYKEVCQKLMSEISS